MIVELELARRRSRGSGACRRSASAVAGEVDLAAGDRVGRLVIVPKTEPRSVVDRERAAHPLPVREGRERVDRAPSRTACRRPSPGPRSCPAPAGRPSSSCPSRRPGAGAACGGFGQPLVGVLEVVLEDRRAALRAHDHRLAQSLDAGSASPAAARGAYRACADLPIARLGIDDLRVALHHVVGAVGRAQLEDAPAPSSSARCCRARSSARCTGSELSSAALWIGIDATRRSRSAVEGVDPAGLALRGVDDAVAGAVEEHERCRRAARPGPSGRAPSHHCRRAVVEADRVPDDDLGVGRRALELEDLAVAGVVQTAPARRARRRRAGEQRRRRARRARADRDRRLTA